MSNFAVKIKEKNNITNKVSAVSETALLEISIKNVNLLNVDSILVRGKAVK